MFADLPPTIWQPPKPAIIRAAPDLVRPNMGVVIPGIGASAGMFGGAVSPATFISEAYLDSGGTVTLPTFAAGDLGIAMGMSSSSLPSIGAGWTQFYSNAFIASANWRLWYRVLQGGDTSVAVTAAGGAGLAYALVLVYRGASLATQQTTSGNVTTATVTCAGWTKSGSAVKELFFFNQQDATTPTTPSGWTLDSTHHDTHFDVRVSSLNPASYVSGTSVSETTCGGVADQAVSVELT